MFIVTVQLRTGVKKAIAPGPRRALALVRKLRATYRVEPAVTADGRAFSESDLRALTDL